VYTASSDFDVSGLGYAPIGEVKVNGTSLDFGNPALYRLIQCAYLCNEADVFQDGEIWLPQGAPTEAALKVLGRKAGYIDDNATKIADIPFDSDYKYRAALYEIDGKKIIFVNGATERIMSLCDQQVTAAGTETMDSAFWESKIEQAAGRGQRLLGFAYAEVVDDVVDINHENLKNMVFCGIVGIIDPPRPEAIESIRVCREAGIRVKMITGDHVLTAREIGRQMGLTDDPKVISGAELENMNDEQIRVAALECDIFARTSPEHKLRLVKALQESGEVVAMTGDGVNDAPALKRADIGVAMGIKGTEVTKDSAEMVLADDNFSSIVSAVEEGRTIYDNIRKTLLFLLPTNGAQALVIITAIIFNFAELPITPVQILWVNMVVAVTLALTMAFEPTEQNVMRQAPRSPKEPLLGGVFLFRIGFASVIVTALTLAIFFYSNYRNAGENLAYTRTMAVNMLVFGQLFYLFNCRKLNSTIFRGGFFGNKFAFVFAGILVAIQIGFTYLPFMQRWFDTVALPLSDWIYFAAGGFVVLLLVELEKAITSRIFGKK